MKTLLGISGSLRRDSFNTALLREALALVPPGWTTATASIRELPLFDSDLEQDPLPDPVVRFRQAIAAADAVLIATPEYNYSVPGVLKNALDWASRPAGAAVMTRKPVGLMGASLGPVGTSRAQGHLRQVLFGMGSLLFPHGEVLVGLASTKFEGGALTDTKTREFVARYLASFAAFVSPG